MSSSALATRVAPATPDPALRVVDRLVQLADAADRLGLEDRARRARRLAGLLLAGPAPLGLPG